MEDFWLEQSIREAQQRGEFDNLKGQGKPQDLSIDHHAGDWESGFRILKNNGLGAGLDRGRQVHPGRAGGADRARRADGAVPQRPSRDRDILGRVAAVVANDLLARLRRLWSGERRDERAPCHSLADLAHERDRAGQEYLRRSEELNQTIQEYNSSLPFDLLWRERQKISAERAAESFDRLCPPVIH